MPYFSVKICQFQCCQFISNISIFKTIQKFWAKKLHLVNLMIVVCCSRQMAATWITTMQPPWDRCSRRYSLAILAKLFTLDLLFAMTVATSCFKSLKVFFRIFLLLRHWLIFFSFLFSVSEDIYYSSIVPYIYQVQDLLRLPHIILQVRNFFFFLNKKMIL